MRKRKKVSGKESEREMGTCLLSPLTLDYHNDQRKDKQDFVEQKNDRKTAYLQQLKTIL